jgi:general secretion pathway protein K
MKSQKGIALVQVLIISMILISLGIFISQTVRNQISVAQMMKNTFKLRVDITNVEARLLQTLLSNQRYKDKSSLNEIVRSWNFHNEEFTIDKNVTIKIQDLNSLLSLNYTDKFLAYNLLQSLSVNKDDATIFLDSLEDWKDDDDLKRANGAESSYYKPKEMLGPRNGFLQSLSEVEYIRGADILSFEQWSNYTSIELVSAFNPLNAPKTILKALIKDETRVNEVLDLRTKGILTGIEFYRITGIEQDEFLAFATGEKLKVTLKAQINAEQNTNENKQQIIKSFVVTLKARSQLQPVIITDMTWNTL